MMRKKLSFALSLIVSALMLVGCGGQNGSNTAKTNEKKDLSSKVVTNYEPKDMSNNPKVAQDRTDTLIIGTDLPDGVLNPLYTEGAYDQNIVRLLYPEIMIPTKDGKLENYLIESNSLSDDGLTYTFKIKNDANWSDGTPITSKDLEFACKVCCDATYDGPNDFIHGRVKVKGAQEYNEGKSDKISGIEIVNDKEIKITLEEKSSSGLYVLGQLPPIPESYYSKYYKQGNTDGLKQTFKKAGPTSGAYKFVDYKEGQEVDLEANEKFVLGAPKIKNVVFKVTTEDTRLQMLQSGDIDMDEISANNDNIETLESMGYTGYILYPTNGYGYIAFNQAKPIFKDKAVRQALAIGLNREKVVSSIFGHYAQVVNVPQSQVSWVYSEGKNKYEYDLEKAKQILDEAGWKVGSDGIREKDGTKLEINFTGTTPNEVVDSILSVATSDWKELGVKFTSEKMDFPSMKEKQKSGNWDMLFMAWSLAPDPNDADIYKTGGSQNKTAYSNAKVDEIYTKIKNENNEEKLKELYSELYTELNEDLPYIFMYQRNDMYAYNGRVQGLEASPYVAYPYNLYKVSLK